MLYFAVTGGYCSAHPSASRCSPNSFPAELIGILIVAVIVALVVFNWMWKRRAGTSSRAGRLGSW
jgi:hypothetical protein